MIVVSLIPFHCLVNALQRTMDDDLFHLVQHLTDQSQTPNNVERMLVLIGDHGLGYGTFSETPQG